MINLNYYPETDSAYIKVGEGSGTETVEVADGVNVDLGALGELIGIELEHASKHLDSLTLNKAKRKSQSL